MKQTKINKLNLLLYIKTCNLNYILYLIAFLIVIIPIVIVLVTEIPFSSSFTKVFISIASILIIVGKFISLLKKDKGNKTIPYDIGIITGMFISLIINFFTK